MLSFQYIQSKEELNEAVKIWKKEKELAIDLECENNLHHYGAYISLIQISSEDRNWVVDVIALKKIDGLLNIFKDKKIIKIFHDVSFDFRILNHQFKCQPKNVFDSQTAALLLGQDKVGLGSLLEEVFEIKKEKKFQRVDWTKRPLSLAQLNYAVKDTAYLLKLKDWLVGKLKKKNRLVWIKQEMDNLDDLELLYNEQTYIDLPGAKSMKPDQLARLHVLFDERKKMAKKVDKPFFMIFSNKQLLAFAINPPYSSKSWKFLKRVHPIVKTNALKLYELVKNAGEEEYKRPESKRLPIKQYEAINELTELRNKIAEKLKVQGYLLMNNDQIRTVVLGKDLDCLRKWQKKLFVEEKLVKDIIKGNKS